MRTLIIDNYDSFTYNLVQYLRQMAMDVEVARNDRITVDSVRLPTYSWIVVHNSSYDVSSPSTATSAAATGCWSS